MADQIDTLDTIWEVVDDLWHEIDPTILHLDLQKHAGRKRANPRQMRSGILFRLCSGVQWNRLPKELDDDSTLHRILQRWASCRVFPAL